MKVLILAGGMGTRLAEETQVRPKPMVEIGGRPILWHIMKHYSHYGFKEFYIALGYKGEMIKRYFKEYYALNSNMTIDLSSGEVTLENKESEDWTVHLIDTGLGTNTGGRIKRLKPYLEGGTFMVTYGDGVGDVDLHALVSLHKKQNRLATMTAVRPPARYGGMIFEGSLVKKFTEKPQIGEGWVNGGFLVFEPGVFNYLPEDRTSLEFETLEHLAQKGEISAYRHEGFWQCMDTLRDLNYLTSLWDTDNPPWKVW
ncbi:glucose-1-phosphate cytidylyltransferase [Thermodesulfobacteriota bacterium]